MMNLPCPLMPKLKTTRSTITNPNSNDERSMSTNANTENHKINHYQPNSNDEHASCDTTWQSVRLIVSIEPMVLLLFPKVTFLLINRQTLISEYQSANIYDSDNCKNRIKLLYALVTVVELFMLI